MLAAVKEVEDKLGPIDCLIPNAGVASGGEPSFMTVIFVLLSSLASTELCRPLSPLKPLLPRLLFANFL